MLRSNTLLQIRITKKQFLSSISHYKREDIAGYQYSISVLSFKEIYINFVQSINIEKLLKYIL